MQEPLVLDLVNLTAFLTVADQQMHFQAKAKAVNGDGNPAGCMHCSNERQPGAVRDATSAGKESLKILEPSLPCPQASNMHT